MLTRGPKFISVSPKTRGQLYVRPLKKHAGGGPPKNHAGVDSTVMEIASSGLALLERSKIFFFFLPSGVLGIGVLGKSPISFLSLYKQYMRDVLVLRYCYSIFNFHTRARANARYRALERTNM